MEVIQFLDSFLSRYENALSFLARVIILLLHYTWLRPTTRTFVLREACEVTPDQEKWNEEYLGRGQATHPTHVVSNHFTLFDAVGDAF